MFNPSLAHTSSFISSQMQHAEGLEAETKKNLHRAVTISRQAGCGALAVAEKLAHYLDLHPAEDTRPWKVYDSNLIDKVLADHDLPACLAKFLREDRFSQLEDIMADVFEVRPPAATVLRHVAETVRGLAITGNVILIGRGGNMVAAHLPRVLHVRLMAPLEKRIEHCLEAYHMTREQAGKFCHDEDHARKRYFKKYFNADIDDPLLYNMIINTGSVGYDDAARIIGDAVLKMN